MKSKLRDSSSETDSPVWFERPMLLLYTRKATSEKAADSNSARPTTPVTYGVFKQRKHYTFIIYLAHFSY